MRCKMAVRKNLQLVFEKGHDPAIRSHSLDFLQKNETITNYKKQEMV